MKRHTIRELDLNDNGIRLLIESYNDRTMKSEFRVYENQIKGVVLDFVKSQLKEAGNNEFKLAKLVNYLFKKRFKELHIGLKQPLDLD